MDTTLAPESSRVESKLEELRQLCHRSGLKLTRQRVEILRELARSKDHPSAETLFQRVRRRLPGVSLDTVYRTLGTFERMQLVDKLNVSLEHGRYDADRTPHHHLVCRSCKRIEDFLWEDFENEQLPPEVQQWGAVDSRHVVVTGVCSACLEQQGERSYSETPGGIVPKPPEGGDHA